jgi:hypothetical protein
MSWTNEGSELMLQRFTNHCLRLDTLLLNCQLLLSSGRTTCSALCIRCRGMCLLSRCLAMGLCITILWFIDPLLVNNCDRNHEAAAVARQRTAQQWKYCRKRCFLYRPPRGYMTPLTEFSSVSVCSEIEYSGVKWVGWWAVSHRTAVRSLWVATVWRW